MKGKHASQTLKRLAKDLTSHPVLLSNNGNHRPSGYNLLLHLDWTGD